MNCVEHPSAVLQPGLEPYPGWCLTQFIGRGGFSEVWKAEVAGATPLALKFLPSSDNGVASKEIRSLQMVRQLDHPKLIRVERIWIYSTYIVIAMELAEGSLQDLLEAYLAELHTPLPPDQTCLYLRQAAEAIDFLNGCRHQVAGRQVGIQHCDIKPSNLLVFGECLKLTDFGLASASIGPMNFHRRAGTTAYAAPEVFQGRLTNRTDQYALAVSYCELRSGQLPFPEPPPTFDRSYVPPPPDLLMLTEPERPIIARGLNPVPQGRWSSCSEMMDRLAALVT